MNRNTVCATLAAVLFLIRSDRARAQAATASDSAGLAAVTAAIARGNAQWSAGWAKRDAAMVASIFADSGVQLGGSGKVIKGRQLIEQRQHAAMQGADSGVKVTVTTTKVWRDGETAYETGSYRYVYTDNGKPGVDEGTYFTVWQHQRDGSWKLAVDVGFPKA